MKLKNLIAAVLVPAMLLTGCGSDDPQAGAGETADVEPTEIVNAVLAEIPITSGIEKGRDDIDDFYSDIDVSQVESASFALCASGAYPDEIAVMRCADDSAAAGVKAAFEKRLASQSELFSTYTPDEMYKLDTAKIYTVGCYAVFIALSDNDRARDIVDGKLSD